VVIDYVLAPASADVSTFVAGVYVNGMFVAVNAPQFNFEEHILAQSVNASVQSVVVPQSSMAA
jgi:hypothetical protein